jgi:hypothetical protein
MSGIPWVHALAVSLERGDDPQTYAKAFYRLDAYRGTYSNPIFPPDINTTAAAAVEPVGPEGDPPVVLLPPNTRRPPGRPQEAEGSWSERGWRKSKTSFSLQSLRRYWAFEVIL